MGSVQFLIRFLEVNFTLDQLFFSSGGVGGGEGGCWGC